MRIPRLPGPISFLLVMVACVLLPLALVSSWTATTVSDTDTYVDTVTPLASDPDVLEAVRSELGVAATKALARTPAAGQETKEVDRAIVRVTEDERFRDAWAQGNRQVHEQILAVLDDDSSHVDAAGGFVSVDLNGLVGSLVTRLDAAGVQTPTEARSIDATIPLMKASDLERLRGGYHLVNALGFWLPAIWVVLVAVLLLTARRRVAALGHLALGSLLTLGILALSLGIARDLVTRRSPDEKLVQAVWDVVLDPLWATVWTAAIVAAVLLVVRIVLGLVMRNRAQPNA
ncbi:hypothetical protein ASG90_15070 [Nocardioides sp. Soil797]|nr:hypothetical protein ASG90_15070 [Nocardioides sp. Soil797]